MNGARVLVVEDEFLIALEITSRVEEAGYVVVGPAGTLEQALALAEGCDLDAALLDINLLGHSSAPVASVLKRRGIPFAFVSGYDRGFLPSEFQDAPFVAKPYLRRALFPVLDRLICQ
jgi:DNA-binding response OmpR family regulator